MDKQEQDNNRDKADQKDQAAQKNPGITAEKDFRLKNKKLKYHVKADWMTLHVDNKPSASVFYTAYLLESESKTNDRPLTFLFNGGPGSASVFLHMGGVGPQGIRFEEDGRLMPPPVQTEQSSDSWLPFTDLVFVDPVGTGFSHTIENDKAKEGEEKAKKQQDSEYYGIKRDLDALCEFISRFLSLHHRWQSPLFIAGESYGGYRVARLAQQMNEQHGLGVNGAILISPALEFADLDVSDYGISHYLNLFPSLVASSFFHDRVKGIKGTLDDVLEKAEDFALTDYASLLASGDLMPDSRRQQILKRFAQFIGLSVEDAQISGGRISFESFTRMLLRDQHQVIGKYDGTITGIDPFPDRSRQDAPDPTLYPIFRVFKAAINHWLRSELKLDTDREYEVLNEKVFAQWKADEKMHDTFHQVTSMDDLRKGMAANEHMKVFICHGIHDLITPYFASKRFAHQMKLPQDHRSRVTLRNYSGGHMFYANQASRKQWTKDISDFFSQTLNK
ncbi:prolyl oligopeptidase family serine peptidase [Sansalvadorimonas sp. 2012CJ34-2]|uniref:Prolyl oligopeptidase family serine peptidase n=1 Tax=Parendozoicomonas callyspongiae TaxID=2942213 RepID=A0ABT0PKQ8_9GAMM|nr:prolyl oligopeptidase family serine peptidase [Sansalvadorimonas sp. 2012CJ34-2]MCL6271953.1 prolyl oligopeptidase family serine peptidase [Sansalvadorimonas sp. 2012CJ34-2]